MRPRLEKFDRENVSELNPTEHEAASPFYKSNC